MSNPFKEIADSASLMIKKQNDKLKLNIENMKKNFKAKKDKILNSVFHNEPSSEENVAIHNYYRPHASKYEVIRSEEENKCKQKCVKESKSEEAPCAEDNKEDETNEDNDLLLCPISQELMTDPVMTPYGHCFQKKCIEDWLEKHNICPITGQPLEKSQLMPCYTVKAIVEKHLKSIHK